MKNLKKIRKYLQFTQKQLADNINLESANTITIYEGSDNYASLKTVQKIAKISGLSLDFTILDDKCYYPRNIELLTVAKKLDYPFSPKIRDNISNTTDMFLNTVQIPNDYTPQLDTIQLELLGNIHVNIKEVRKYRDISQKVLAERIGVHRSATGLYERNNTPTVENIIKISRELEVSIHALVTGEVLQYDFHDKKFGNLILLADRFLPLEHQKILIMLMKVML